MNEKTVKLSEEKLNYYKGKIVKKIKLIDEFLKNQENSHINPHGTDDTGRSFEVVEDGAIAASIIENDLEVQRQKKLRVCLQNALVRIGNKTYGICRVTGEPIPDGRLRSNLHATTSIPGKEQEKAESLNHNNSGKHQVQSQSTHGKFKM